MRPRSLSDVVARARLDGDWEHHLRDFLDAFYAADGDTARQATFVAQDPDRLGVPEADAFLGGVGEHLARRWGLPIPAWVRAGDRYLTKALFATGLPDLRQPGGVPDPADLHGTRPAPARPVPLSSRRDHDAARASPGRPPPRSGRACLTRAPIDPGFERSRPFAGPGRGSRAEPWGLPQGLRP